MRNIPITSGEYYHIYNRGNNKQVVFINDKDRMRFLFLVLYFQSPIVFSNIVRYVDHYVKKSVFNVNTKDVSKIIKTRYVELVGFVLMPNHFHLIVYGVKDKGISQYMQRILNSYTKYFNTRHKRIGHLFQGPYNAKGVYSEEQLLYLSAYIHKNPQDIKGWAKKEHLFPWSSYQDYVKENRWGELLKKDIVSEQFSSGEDYKEFIETSGAKEELEGFDE